MPRITESLATINSVIRTMLALVIVGGAAVGVWFGYSYYTNNLHDRRENIQKLIKTEKDLELATVELNRVKSDLDAKSVELENRLREIAALQLDLKKKEEEIQKLDTSLRLLKVTERIARLSVIDQGADNDSGELYTVVEFVELDPQGTPLGEPRRFRVKGDMIYIDSWVVKFEDKYVEQADIDRATSLVLFRRLFGQFQEPDKGESLDPVGVRPQVYASGGEMSDFEKKIWDDFWTIANDPQRANELGIRAIHGEAPNIKMKKGMVYKILLRASGGLSIIPDPDAQVPVAPGTTS